MLTLGALGAGCVPRAGISGVLRIGLLSRLTDVPMMTALESGRLAAALPHLRLEVRVFRAGPRVTEALLGGAIDLGTSGPAPIVATHTRHANAPLAVVSGLCSGGASLVTLPSIRTPADLRNRVVATPQLGSSLDVSLRKWLALQGLFPTELGGDVKVEALSPANVYAELARGGLAGAWLQEPWASRAVLEFGARRLDERKLWPQGQFPSALLVARRDFLRARPDDTARLVAAIGSEIDRTTDVAATRAAAVRGLRLHGGMTLSDRLVDEALSYVRFTRDPLPAALATFAADVARLGYGPSASITGLIT